MQGSLPPRAVDSQAAVVKPKDFFVTTSEKENELFSHFHIPPAVTPTTLQALNVQKSETLRFLLRHAGGQSNRNDSFEQFKGAAWQKRWSEWVFKDLVQISERQAFDKRHDPTKSQLVFVPPAQVNLKNPKQNDLTTLVMRRLFFFLLLGILAVC